MTRDYVYALRYRWLTPLYDPVIRWTMREDEFRRLLLDQANVQPGQRALDVGCGTGTLAVALKQRQPAADVVGVDGDPDVLDTAREKASKAGLEVEFRQALAQRLPFPDGAFDLVLSSLLFHHLTSEDKRAAMREAHRILRPGGAFHLADWGKPAGLVQRLAFVPVQLLDGFANTRDHVEGRLPSYLSEAGFQAEETGRLATALGTLTIVRGTKPGLR